MGFYRDSGLSYKYSMSKWDLIAKEQGGWSVGGKLLRGNIRDKEVLAKPTQKDCH